MAIPKLDKKTTKKFSYDNLVQSISRLERKLEKAEAKRDKLISQTGKGAILSRNRDDEIEALDKFIDANAANKKVHSAIIGDRRFSVYESMSGGFMLGSIHRDRTSSQRGQSILISLDRTASNIQAAWDAMIPAILTYAPHSVDVIGVDAFDEPADGHEVEIRLPKGMPVEKTENFLRQLQTALNEAKVNPGPAGNMKNTMPGSQFISYEGDARKADLDVMHINPNQPDLSKVYRRIHLITALINKQNAKPQIDMLRYDKLTKQYDEVMIETKESSGKFSPAHQVPLRACLKALEKAKLVLDKKQQLQSLSAPLSSINLNSEHGVTALVQYVQDLHNFEAGGGDPEIVKTLLGPSNKANVHDLIKQHITAQQHIYQQLQDSSTPNINLMLIQSMAHKNQLAALMESSMSEKTDVMLSQAQVKVDQQISKSLDSLKTNTKQLIDSGNTQQLVMHKADLQELKTHSNDDNTRKTLETLTKKVSRHLSHQKQKKMMSSFKGAHKSSKRRARAMSDRENKDESNIKSIMRPKK